MDGRKVNVKEVKKNSNDILDWKIIVIDNNKKREILDISQIHTIGGT